MLNVLILRIARNWKHRVSAVTVCRLYFNSPTSVQWVARYIELTTDLLMVSRREYR